MRIIAFSFLLTFPATSFASTGLGGPAEVFLYGYIGGVHTVLTGTLATIIAVDSRRMNNNYQGEMSSSKHYFLGGVGVFTGGLSLWAFLAEQDKQPALIATSSATLLTGVASIVVGTFVKKYKKRRSIVIVSPYLDTGDISTIGLTLSFR